MLGLCFRSSGFTLCVSGEIVILKITGAIHRGHGRFFPYLNSPDVFVVIEFLHGQDAFVSEEF